MRVGQQFARFLLIGAVGFIVDGGLLLALIEKVGLSTLLARLASFSVAVTVTWFLNRLWTFRDRASRQRFTEWLRYAAVSGFGGLLNLSVFALLAGPMPGLGVSPLAALTVASGAALIFNFIGSRAFAFRDRRDGVADHEAAPPPL